MGKGMEEEGVGLVGRAWEVDLKETRPPYGLLQLDVRRELIAAPAQPVLPALWAALEASDLTTE